MTRAYLYRIFILRYVWLRPLRFFFNVLGVAFGVALFVSIDLINGVVLNNFNRNIDAIAGRAEIVISRGQDGLAEEVLETVIATPGVSYAAPLIEERASLKIGEEFSRLSVLGVDLLKDQQIRDYESEGDDVIDDPLEFMNQEDSIIVTKSFADRFKLKLEDQFSVYAADGVKTFTVRGMMVPTGPALAFGGSLAVMDIDGARATFGKEGRYDRIDVVVGAEAKAEEVIARLQERLGPAVQVERSELRRASMTRAVRAFQKFLVVLSSLGWLVGLFLVGNAVAISVGLRRNEIGMMRAIGASRQLILGLFVGEGALLGLLGGGVGFLVGVQLADFLAAPIQTTMATQFQATFETIVINWSTRDLTMILLASGLTSMAVALWPAARAAMISPVSAMRFVEQALTKTNLMTSLVCGWGLRILRRWGQSWRVPVVSMGINNLVGRQGEVSLQIAMLSLSLSFSLFVAVTVVSMKTSMFTWLDNMLPFDFAVSGHGDYFSHDIQPLRDSAVREIETALGDLVDPESVLGRRTIKISLLGQQVQLVAQDRPGSSEVRQHIFTVKGSQSRERIDHFFAPDSREVFISESLPQRLKKSVGDQLEIDTPFGRESFLIAGLVRDYEFVDGAILMPRVLYKKTWRDQLVSSIEVKLRDSTQIEEARRRLDSQTSRDMGFNMTEYAPFVEVIRRQISASFDFLRPLQSISIVVALIGLLSTMIVRTSARTKELGGLSAIGMDKSQMLIMLAVEGALIALNSALWILLMLPWFVLWIYYGVPLLLGWVVDFYMPWGELVTLLGFGLLVAVIASIIASRPFFKMSTTEALRYD